MVVLTGRLSLIDLDDDGSSAHERLPRVTQGGEAIILPVGGGRTGRSPVAGPIDLAQVDAGAELDAMVATQRAYSAAARVRVTVDQVLGELRPLRR